LGMGGAQTEELTFAVQMLDGVSMVEKLKI